VDDEEEQSNIFVGREASPPRKSAKFVSGIVTAEIGCGPDDAVHAVIKISPQKPLAEAERAAEEAPQASHSEDVAPVE